MQLISDAFEHNQPIPLLYTCDGKDTNPPLSFGDVPDGAKSLALIMEDPDVPQSIRPDGMWDHWLIWNMPPNTTDIPEAGTPPGVEGSNTGGKIGYGGPCPPDRRHRYFFKLFALDAMLDLPASASKSELEKAIEQHVIDRALLVGTYTRSAR